jgi:phosphate transport system protein
LTDIAEMSKASQKMLRDSLDAFVNKDSKLAKDVCRRDDEVDNLNKKIFMEFLRSVSQDEKTIERAVDLILIAKNLERIADHSTNICEDVIYIVEGKTIKHHMEERELERQRKHP